MLSRFKPIREKKLEGLERRQSGPEEESRLAPFDDTKPISKFY